MAAPLFFKKEIIFGPSPRRDPGCDNSRIRNVFWADARTRAACKYFGDVISFDTTYLTNKYDMPFAPFVGVNHHWQSILLGCGLLSSKDTSSFFGCLKVG